MKKKILALVLVFALALAMGIGGTLAWLTAKTNAVVNTFTVGNITLTLKEYAGTEELDTDAEKQFKIVPGASNNKEPKLTVGSGSEKCYLYACVTNNVKIGNDTVATPDINTTDWVAVGTKDNATVYRYKDIIDASAADVTKSVFTKVTYANTITQSTEHTTALTNTTISVQGFAHQSDNTDQATADAAAKSQFGLN